MYQGGLTQRWFVIYKKRILRHTENKARVLIFMSQVISNNKSIKNICEHSLPEAKMFKIEKCILNYAYFKHP